MKIWEKLKRALAETSFVRGSDSPPGPAAESAELLRTRVIQLDAAIDDRTAAVTVAKGLFLLDADPATPFTLEVETPGGQVAAGLAIADFILEHRPLVATRFRTGAAGIGVLLLAAGAPRCRGLSRLASLRLRPIEGDGRSGESAEIERTRAIVAELFEACTGRPRTAWRDAMLGKQTLDPKDALHWGIIDRIE